MRLFSIREEEGPVENIYFMSVEFDWAINRFYQGAKTEVRAG